MSRKAILNALLAQLAPAGGAFVTSGRRLRDPEHIATLAKPALFLIKPNERYERNQGNAMPPMRVLEVYAVLYTDVGDDETAVPADALDDLLDAVDAALAPSVADQVGRQGRQTLGGLVHNCIITGDADLAPGDIQGKGTAVVPIHVYLLPNRSLS